MTPEIRELRRRESIALVCYQEGLALHESDLKGAEDCYTKAIDIVPNHVGAMCGLASIFAETRRVKKAKDLFLKVLKINPGQGHALIELARLYSRLRKPQYFTCAAALYATALAADLDNTEAAKGLRRSMDKLGLGGQGSGNVIAEVGLECKQVIGLLETVCSRLKRCDERAKSCHALKNLLTQDNLVALERRRRPPAPANVSNAPEVTASA